MERVRYAGVMERFHICLTDLESDTCVVASATYSSKLEPTAVIDRTTALRALKRVVHGHLALCVQLEGEFTEKPCFVRLPRFDLNNVLEYSTDAEKSVEELMASELLKPLERSSSRPLWRVVVRSDNIVLFAWHHALADGTCAHSFHSAFLSALNATSEEKEDLDSVITAPEKLEIAPTIEQLTNTSVSFKTICKTLYGAFAPASWKPLARAWTGNPIVSEPQPQLKLQVRLRKIEPEAARRLVLLCRDHKCTITSFFHTLGVYVLSHLLSTSKADTATRIGLGMKHRTLSTVVPISLRRFTNLSPLEICDCTSVYHTYTPILRDIQPEKYPPTRDTFPWNAASEYGVSLRGFIPKSLEVVGVVGFIFKFGMSRRYFVDRLGKKRENTLVVSNIGVMPPLPPSEDDGGGGGGVLWEVDNVCFGQNDSVYGAMVKINMAGSPSGAINISYTWGVDNVELAFAEAFVEDMHRVVKAILVE